MDAISPPPYWYGEDMDDRRGARVMESLRAYRAAEMAMRRRTQDTMAMSENELVVLRFLTRASSAGADVTPADLARHLGVSTASITALLDRLERSDHVRRERHPTDRRKVLVRRTAQTEDEMRDTLGTLHARMMAATRGMSETDADAVTAFLNRMRCAVGGRCAATGDSCCRIAKSTGTDQDAARMP
ncbi:MarR family winged helix-turn-helix transcriptional regulator [Microbacterium proteolyticum]|jgi:DNA-binding MarR family transcriptional regulator|uniref:MarR family winged helix-turn-helix transcriptional regulator n=1 Tax=Microbacterium proteolyticum TaxID=1572644 RepID=UPI0035C14120